MRQGQYGEIWRLEGCADEIPDDWVCVYVCGITRSCAMLFAVRVEARGRGG